MEENKKYILYVDDDADDRELMEDLFLPGEPYALVSFAGGRELFEFLNSRPTADGLGLIILDMNMPQMSGADIIEALQREDRYSQVPIVMFSSTRNEGEQNRAKKHGVDFINKPLHYNHLADTKQKLVSYCR
jgi:CheY-like chemotaxis protein